MVITSLDNEKVKKYVRLKEKKYRDIEDQFIVEGIHLVQEAYKKGLIEEIILEENEEITLDSPKVYVTKEIIKKISTLETPVNILALCNKMVPSYDYGNKLLLLDKIQDPGNLGTIIRSSKAFNVDTLVLGDETVDIYNPKVIRSTQGMMFHINIIHRNLKDFIFELKERNIPVYGTNVEHGEDIRTLNDKDKEKYALIMGNEGSGVSKEILELCDQYIYIKMNHEVESLNVAIATSILLYELDRRG